MHSCWKPFGFALASLCLPPGNGMAQTLTEFCAGLGSGAQPVGIAAGADGNLWFTEFNGGNRIGRVTPQGVISEFSAGLNGGAQPYAIAAGSDGNLWFTEQNGNRIGRITPSGPVILAAVLTGILVLTAIR